MEVKFEPVRLAELLAALSLATDLGMGQPSGHAVQTCALSVQLARDLQLSDDQVSDVFYVALSRYLGCTADASEVARLAGDDIDLARAVGPYVMGEVIHRVSHTDVPNQNKQWRPRWRPTARPPACSAADWAWGAGTAALGHGFERYDGKGHPSGLASEGVPLPIRISVLARDVLLWQRLGGPAAARDIVSRRRGRADDPQVVDAYLRSADNIADIAWEDFLAAEACPARLRRMSWTGCSRYLPTLPISRSRTRWDIPAVSLSWPEAPGVSLGWMPTRFLL